MGRGARSRRRGDSAQRSTRAARERSGIFSCSKATNEVNYARAEVRPRGGGQQQHRQLQPYLTRPQRRRSGDGLRSRRRHELVPRGRGDRRHPPVGHQRARDAPDLLPPRAQGRAHAARGSTSSIRAAPRPASGPTAGWPRRRHATSRSPTRWAANHRSADSRTAPSSRARRGLRGVPRSVAQYPLARGRAETGVAAS